MWLLGLVMAAPVSLPAGTPVEDWAPLFRQAGLEPGAPGAGAWVVLAASGDHWTLTVRDQAGGLHTVDVVEPTSAGDRQDLVWLAASLLEPVGPSEVGLIPPPPEPEPPPTRPVSKPPPVAVVAVPPPEPEPAVVEVVEVLPPPPEPEGPHTYVELGVGVTDRLVPSLELGVGRSAWHLSTGMRFPERSQQLEDVGFWAFAVGLERRWRYGELQPSLGIDGELRRWAYQDLSRSWILLPVAGAHLAYSLPLKSFVVEPRLSLTADLRPTSVTVGAHTEYQPWLRGAFSVAIRHEL